jgi:hypothetical protein
LRVAGLEAGVAVALGAATQVRAAAAQSTRAKALIHAAIGAHHSNEHPESRDGWPLRVESYAGACSQDSTRSSLSFGSAYGTMRWNEIVLTAASARLYVSTSKSPAGHPRPEPRTSATPLTAEIP